MNTNPAKGLEITAEDRDEILYMIKDYLTGLSHELILAHDKKCHPIPMAELNRRRKMAKKWLDRLTQDGGGEHEHEPN